MLSKQYQLVDNFPNSHYLLDIALKEYCKENVHTDQELMVSSLSFQVRFMLKIHAFVRENAPKVLSYKRTQGNILQ